jgi:transposase
MNQYDKNKDEIFKLKSQGISTSQIAKTLGVARSGLYTWLNKQGKTTGKNEARKQAQKRIKIATLPTQTSRPMVAFIGTSQEITETIKQLFS